MVAEHSQGLLPDSIPQERHSVNNKDSDALKEKSIFLQVIAQAQMADLAALKDCAPSLAQQPVTLRTALTALSSSSAQSWEERNCHLVSSA